jgi:hypothetical protein
MCGRLFDTLLSGFIHKEKETHMSNIFQEVRENVTIAQAIEYLGLKATETKGDQLRFGCPKCGGTDQRTLSVNLQKGFRCFAGDKKGDDATALVAHCKGIRNGQAAQELKDHFVDANKKVTPAARSPSATKPEVARPRVKGRGESANALSPLELLGVSTELADRLHIEQDGGFILFEQRDERGIKLGTLAIATRDDLPLVSWIADGESENEETGTTNSLQSLWRVVKGGA